MDNIVTQNKYPKGFDFKTNFSPDWRAHKQKNKIKNISNYRIHKSSLQKYNKCGQKTKSWIVKGIDRWFILNGNAIYEDKFNKDFYVVGVTPQFFYWSRDWKDASTISKNKSIKGLMFFEDMVALEQFDHFKFIAEQNRLTREYDLAEKERARKLEYYNKIKDKFMTTEDKSKLASDVDEDKPRKPRKRPPKDSGVTSSNFDWEAGIDPERYQAKKDWD